MNDLIVSHYDEKSKRNGFTSAQDGSSLVEVALIIPILLLVLVGAVDFGRGYYMSIEVNSAAEAAACYGVQQPSDTSGITAAASLDASDVPGLTATVSTGCECSDGSFSSPNCSSPPSSCNSNVVNYVAVSTAATYSPMMHYPGIPASFPLAAKATMRSAH